MKAKQNFAIKIQNKGNTAPNWIEIKTIQDLFHLAATLSDDEINQLTKELSNSLIIFKHSCDAMCVTDISEVEVPTWKWANDKKDIENNRTD